MTREKCNATPIVGVNAVLSKCPAVYYQIASTKPQKIKTIQ